MGRMLLTTGMNIPKLNAKYIAGYATAYDFIKSVDPNINIETIEFNR